LNAATDDVKRVETHNKSEDNEGVNRGDDFWESIMFPCCEGVFLPPWGNFMLLGLMIQGCMIRWSSVAPLLDLEGIMILRHVCFGSHHDDCCLSWLVDGQVQNRKYLR
jgi:hypothetical protein